MQKTYMNIDETKSYVKLAKSTIYSYVHEHKIPHIKVGDRILFEQEDLTKWMEKRKKGVTNERTK